MLPVILSHLFLAVSFGQLVVGAGLASSSSRRIAPLQARTNAEAIQLGQPLLKPRLAATRVGSSLRRRRASPAYGSETIDFEDLVLGVGDEIFIDSEYRDKHWDDSIVVEKNAYPQVPAGSGANWLYVNPGPVFGSTDTTGWNGWKPVISTPNGSPSLRLRSLVCGKASDVAKDAVLTVIGSVGGTEIYGVDLACPEGSSGQYNALGNLAAVDTISFRSGSGFTGMVDDVVCHTVA